MWKYSRTGNLTRSFGESAKYKQGAFLENSGFVRVTVATDKITLNYVKPFPGMPVAYSYTITAK